MPKITPPKTDLGAEIRRLRDDVLRLTQQELADAMHVKANVISRWEVGINAPNLQSLARLARLVGKTEAEERRLFQDLAQRAGNPQSPVVLPRELLEELDRPQQELPAAATIEGELARAAVDYVSDPDLRLRMVLTLRDMARRSQGAAEETQRDPHPSS